jgi:hypothetical protein
MTAGLTFGPLDQHGRMKVTLVYDHRLMDGTFVAERLIELEQQLTGSVFAELREPGCKEHSPTNAEECPASAPDSSHHRNAA